MGTERDDSTSDSLRIELHIGIPAYAWYAWIIISMHALCMHVYAWIAGTSPSQPPSRRLTLMKPNAPDSIELSFHTDQSANTYLGCVTWVVVSYEVVWLKEDSSNKTVPRKIEIHRISPLVLANQKNLPLS